MKRVGSILLTIAMAASLTACAQEAEVSSAVQASAPEQTVSASAVSAAPAPADQPESGSAGEAVTMIAHSENDMFTDRDYEIGCSDYVTVTLQNDSAQADGSGVETDKNTVTITQQGSYLFTGTLNGQIFVDVPDTDKVQLVLDGADITSPDSAAIYIKSADKVFLTTARDSENTLCAGGEFVQQDDNTVDGAVFAKSDLTLNGAGALTVQSEAGHGIVTKDDLKITSGSYTVTAASQGLSGKNSVRVSGGDITIDSGKDGIHSEHSEDPEKGFIYIIGGTFQITCGNDALDASSVLTIEDGSFQLSTNGGADNAPVHVETRMGGPAPTGDTQTDLDDLTSDSYKGLKAETIAISGGTFLIDAADDAVHANDALIVSGGSFSIHTGDDAFHADVVLEITDGDIVVAQSYEGIEGEQITVSGGVIDVTAYDDALKASGAAPALHISGGEIQVSSGGDSLDSNGSLCVSGGTVHISGPENSGNGMLDYDGTGEITGGTLVGTGAMGMNQNFGNTSAQCSILADLPAQQTAGTTVTLTDESGAVIAEYTPEKAYQTVLISTPELETGKTYTLTAGSETVTVELTDTIYGVGGGFGGGRGRIF